MEFAGSRRHLRQIYGVIGEFRENAFDMAGGLHAGHELEPASEGDIWIEPGGPIDPAAAIPFLETLSGSKLCYLSEGGGAWLESCRFRPVKHLDRLARSRPSISKSGNPVLANAIETSRY